MNIYQKKSSKNHKWIYQIISELHAFKTGSNMLCLPILRFKIELGFLNTPYIYNFRLLPNNFIEKRLINKNTMFYNISPEPTEVDQIYQVLKQATEISNSKPRVNVEIITPVDKSAPGSGSNPGSSGSSGQSLNRRAPPLQPSRAIGSTLNVVNPAPCSTSSGL